MDKMNAFDVFPLRISLVAVAVYASGPMSDDLILVPVNETTHPTLPIGHLVILEAQS
jgi:hypothetical protein